MRRKKRSHEFRHPHFVLLIGSIALAFYLSTPDAVQTIHGLEAVGYVGALITGFFFASFLTTIPATVTFFLLGETLFPPMIALLGALGAMTLDYVIFSVFRHQISHHYGVFDNMRRWFSKRRVSSTLKAHPFLRYTIPFTGALIIASPLPDELGIAVLGASKFTKKRFLILSFCMNYVGIMAISSLGSVF